MSLTLIDVVLFSAGLFFIWKLFLSRQQTLPYPPGPRGYPVIGNLLDMPKREQHKIFSQMALKYGRWTYLTVLGQPMLIVNDISLANDLMDKRGTLYSDRHETRMAGEMAGWNNTLIMQQYGPRCREYRKHFFRIFGNQARVEEYLPLYESAGRKLLQDLVDRPDDFCDAIRHTAGRIILKIAYGYSVKNGEDKFVGRVHAAMSQLSELFVHTYMVDFFPFLQCIPEWFPGAAFQRTAKHYRETLLSTVNIPMEVVKQEIADGVSTPSLVANELTSGRITTFEAENNLKWAAASIYGGGADTTVSAMQTFFLAMTMFPQAQKKAQAEVDAIVGFDRLPTLGDRPNLPFVTALFYEVLRWNPVVPTGVPHRLREDDTYDGYLLPKGTVVIANQWHMLHDPAVYKDPMRFSPERFMESPGSPAEQDPHLVAFGFGRRICPGVNLADATVWLEIAMILSTLNITKALDENGREIIPSGNYIDGLISFPESFRCSIKPRSSSAESLIYTE